MHIFSWNFQDSCLGVLLKYICDHLWILLLILRLWRQFLQKLDFFFIVFGHKRSTSIPSSIGTKNIANCSQLSWKCHRLGVEINWVSLCNSTWLIINHSYTKVVYQIRHWKNGIFVVVQLTFLVLIWALKPCSHETMSPKSLCGSGTPNYVV